MKNLRKNPFFLSKTLLILAISMNFTGTTSTTSDWNSHYFLFPFWGLCVCYTIMHNKFYPSQTDSNKSHKDPALPISQNTPPQKVLTHKGNITTK